MQGQAVCSCTSGSITGEMMVILSPVVSALSTAVGTPASGPDATLVGCGSFRAQDSQCLAETTSPPLPSRAKPHSSWLSGAQCWRGAARISGLDSRGSQSA